MAKSLQEQLLGAGLTNKAKAKTSKTNKRKQTQAQRKNKLVVVDETAEAMKLAKLKLIEKDKVLNLQKQQIAAKKALVAQVKQLIESKKIPQDKEGGAYNFSDGSKVKKIYVSDEVRDQLVKGRLAIVKIEKSYEIVTAEVAEKIHQRDENCVLLLNEGTSLETLDENDPYADYQVPDDLIW
ncbi:MAG: DUF2058 domain-containing protein [Methylococcales bacterium]|nr:DUF2058 domain-containing protein [Methylococcales bacterium]